MGIAASLSSFANSHNNLPQGGDHQRSNSITNSFINSKKDPLSSPRQQQQSTHNSLNEWQNGLVALLPSSVKVNFATSDQQQQRINNYNNFSSTQQQQNPLAGGGGRGQSNFSSSLYDQWSSGSLQQQQQQSFSLFGGGAGSKSSSFFGANGLIGAAAATNSDKFSSTGNRVAPPPGLSPFAGDPAIIASSATNVKSTPPSSRTNTHSLATDDTPHWMKSLQMLTLDGEHGNNTATNNELYDATRMAFSGLPTVNHTSTAPSLGGNGSSHPPPGFHSRHLFAGGNSDFGRRHGGLLENQS